MASTSRARLLLAFLTIYLVWAVAGEEITAPMAFAAAIIVGSVVLIVAKPAQNKLAVKDT